MSIYNNYVSPLSSSSELVAHFLLHYFTGKELAMVDRAGERFAEYRLVRRLGGGTFGDVYLSEHINDKIPAAIKILQARLVNSEDLKDFINEVRILFRLQHPNIVPLKDFGIENDVPFLVMDYASHGTLRQPKGHRLPVDTVVTYTSQIAAALQYAHDRKLIHRDVKPDNILLGPANQVWLSDFGIASIAHSSRSLNTQEGAGTIAYMAPEQIMGKPRLASDQYALGIIVYEWLSGQRPFHGTSTEVAMQHTQAPPPSLREKVPTISPAVEEVVMTALSKEPQQRFANIQAFARALEQASQRESSIAFAMPVEIKPGLHELSDTPPPTGVTIELVSQGPTPPVTPHTDPPVPQKEPIRTPPTRETTFAPVNTQHRVSSKRKRTLVLALLLFLVIAGTIGTYFSIVTHNTAQMNATNTARANITATAQAIDINATATAQTITNATATAQAIDINTTVTAQTITNATDTKQNPYPPGGGILAFNDPLNNYGNDWCHFLDSTEWKFPGDGLHVITTGNSGPGSIPCIAGSTNFSNLVYQVQMTVLKGDGGGIIFRSDINLASYYHFSISQDGSYTLALASNNYKILQTGSSPLIDFGKNRTYLIGLVARGGSFDIYINLHLVVSVNDGTLTQGAIGVEALTDGTGTPSDVVFQKAKVWTL